MAASRPPFDLNDFRPPNVPERMIKLVAAGIVIAVLLFTSWFTISPEEVGVVLRFGAFTRTVDSGLNFKIPFGIEEVYKVPVERQEKQEFGFRTLEPGTRSTYSKANFEDESLMLTGDLNAAEVEWIIQYRITDPYKFLFRVRNAEQTLRDINEAVVREIVGDRTVNEVLTTGRTEIAGSVQVKIQELCDIYELGIKIDQLVLQDVNPPDPVKPAFNEVNESQQEREKLINQAQSEYNRVIPKARGEAARAIEEARGYALKRVNESQGEAARFNALYGAYARAPEVTKQRIYLETMTKVMQKVDRKFITDDKASGILPLFDFNQKGTK